jgi:hypothetical protein
MKRIDLNIVTTILVFVSTAGWAAPLSITARTLIPSEARQIFSLDYSTLKQSDTGMSLKSQVLPENLKECEAALKGIGLNPDKDLSNLTVASFHDEKLGLTTVGIASGSFYLENLAKAKSVKYNNHDFYPLSSEMTMTFVDESTLLFGKESALRVALDTRDRQDPNIDSNQRLVEMIKSVEKAPVWSVLDRQRTQNMLLAALGDGDVVARFASVKDHILGSHYDMSFSDGVEFNVDVLTSDEDFGGAVRGLFKAGMLYKKITSNPEQKIALDHVSVTGAPVVKGFQQTDLRLHFKADQQKLLELLHSGCFAALSSEQEELSGMTSGPVNDRSKVAEASSPPSR